MSGALAATVSRLTGARVTACVTLHGGDLSEVFRLSLADGRQIVAKSSPLAAAEARMLRALHGAGAPAPAVLGCTETTLLLEFLQEIPPTASGWAALGEALACLHASGCGPYGWEEDYAFGTVEIPAARSAGWPEFWAEHRLLAGLETLPPELAARLETLSRHLPDLLPAAPPAALLHGDLWTGNLLFTGAGPYLIDPACCRGHAEADLAMLHLFGNPPAGFHEAYGPLDPDYETRRLVYQLWPALVHLRLFGACYRSMVETRLAALGF